jgi:hypothetical protein
MAWRAYTPERLLDGQGQRLWPFHEARGSFETRRGDHWLSETEALEYSFDAGKRKVHVASLNVRSGLRHEFAKLSQRISQDSWRSSVDLQPILPSPNGQWLILWYLRFEPKTPSAVDYRTLHRFTAVSLDGTRKVAWLKEVEAERFVFMGWLPDGETFAVMSQTEACLYRVDRPSAVQKKAITQLPGVSGGSFIRPDGTIVVQTPSSYQTTDRVVLHMRQVTSDPPRSWTEEVRLPFRCRVLGVEADDAGKRLLWYLLFEEKPPRARFLAPLLRRLGLIAHSRTGIWVSRMDGSDMRGVGHVDDNLLGSVGWLPGGRYIQYARKGVWYRLRVP